MLFTTPNIYGEVKSPTLIILDTDMGPDYDDVGALAMLNALSDNGESLILGIMTSNRYKYTVPCVEIINSYYGRKNILIGETKIGLTVTDENNNRWTDILAEKYTDNWDKHQIIPDAVDLYRKILSESVDNSIIVVCIGYLTNLAALLQSKPDKYSEMNGRCLVEKKVKSLVVMGGQFPSGLEYNFMSDIHSTKYVAQNWPSKIVFCGVEIGNEVFTGRKLIQTVATNPIKDAYYVRMKDGDIGGRQSWDQIAILVAVKGIRPYFESIKGKIIVNSDGSNSWIKCEHGSHEFLLWNYPPKKLEEIIENLIIQEPLNLNKK